MQFGTHNLESIFLQTLPPTVYYIVEFPRYMLLSSDTCRSLPSFKSFLCFMSSGGRVSVPSSPGHLHITVPPILIANHTAVFRIES